MVENEWTDEYGTRFRVFPWITNKDDYGVFKRFAVSVHASDMVPADVRYIYALFEVASGPNFEGDFARSLDLSLEAVMRLYKDKVVPILKSMPK